MAKITSTEELDAIRAAFLAGMTVRDAARHVGISKDAIYRARDRGEIDISLAHKGYDRRPTPSGTIDIPVWVVKAGLAGDFRDLRREVNEEYAIRQCRELTADLRRFNAAAFR